MIAVAKVGAAASEFALGCVALRDAGRRSVSAGGRLGKAGEPVGCGCGLDRRVKWVTSGLLWG